MKELSRWALQTSALFPGFPTGPAVLNFARGSLPTEPCFPFGTTSRIAGRR